MQLFYFNILFVLTAIRSTSGDTASQPPTNKFDIQNDLKNYCLIFQAGFRLEFNYTLAKNTTQWVINSTDIPKLDKADGNCTLATQQSLVLTFFNNWKLKIQFENNATTSQYTLSEMELSFFLVEGVMPFPQASNASGGAKIVVSDEWCDKFGSYVCTGRRSYTPSAGSSHFVAMEMYNEQYNAFINSTKPEFTANVRRCSGDSISNLIPIVVGAALGGLIVIVLIAYMIGRHRSKKGYEAV